MVPSFDHVALIGEQSKNATWWHRALDEFFTDAHELCVAKAHSVQEV